LAKLKKIETEPYPHEVLAEDEPRYLRRQKPVEIKRRKFGKKAWKGYFRFTLIALATAALGGALFGVGEFLFTSPAMALASPSQVDLSGNHFVARSSVLEIFAPDRGRSVLRVPLAARRAQIEALPWVERATVRRALPNRIEVEIVERTPIAFVRDGTDLFLADKDGMILDRPLEADFHFPVVIGINAVMPREDRARRMQMMSDFMAQIRAVRADAGDSVSEIDLSDADDVQATFAGLQASGTAIPGALLVHFGNSDFHDKFQVLLNNVAQWQAAAGRIASVDLRFEREVVVNPENPAPAVQPAMKAAPVAAAPAHKAASLSHARLASEATTKVSRPVHKSETRAKAKSKPGSKATQHKKKKRAASAARAPAFEAMRIAAGGI
jgi:cell division protein FtsQ